MKNQSNNDGAIEYRSQSSRGEYRINKGGRWSGWVKVNGGLQEAEDGAVKAQREYFKNQPKRK